MARAKLRVRRSARLAAATAVVVAVTAIQTGAALAQEASESPPDRPTDLQTNRIIPCRVGADRPFIRTTTPRLSATVTDPDSFVRARFRWGLADTGEVIGEHLTGSQPSGTTFQTTVPAGDFQHGQTIFWQAQGDDGTGTSPWTRPCELTIDTVPPDQPPGVSSAEYPEEQFSGGVGQRGLFNFSPNGVPDVVGYRYGFNRNEPSTSVTADPVTRTATISFTPWSSGTNILVVQSRDRAGNLSPVRSYAFFVNFPTEPIELLKTRAVSAADAGGSNGAGDKFAASSAAGDFNGDGFNDLAVGAPKDVVDGFRAGAVFVYGGSVSGINASGQRLVQRAARARSEPGDRFGAALAAGDFNDDGFDDLAIGAPGEDLFRAFAGGVVFVFTGSPDGLTRGFYRTQGAGGGASESGDRFGSALAVGDLDGDGISDLAVGAPGDSPGGAPSGGAVYVLPGATGLRNGSSRTQEDGGGTTEAGDGFGRALAIGDVNGSGRADLVVGAPDKHADDSGIVYVLNDPLHGGGFSLTQANAGEVAEAGDRLGAAVAVGDFNGDDLGDIAVGAPAGRVGSGPRGGLVYSFDGDSSATPTGRPLSQAAGGEVDEAGDRFGASLSAADMDDDGLSDLLAGIPGETLDAGAASGAALVFVGRGGGLQTARLLTARELGSSPASGDQFGSSTAIADLNDDARAELVIGAPGDAPSGGLRAGVVHTLAGLMTMLVREGRVEAITDHSVTISAQSNRPGGVFVQYRPVGSTTWAITRSASFDPAQDFTATVTISGLTPNTTYEYRLVPDVFVAGLTLSSFTTLPTPVSGASR